MKNFTLFMLLSITLMYSCKSIERYTKKGDYESAVDYAISKFDKNKKLKDKEVKYLERAHKSLLNDEISKVKLKSLDPKYSYRSLYRDISKIDRVQKKIYPYLPIVSKDGYKANFNFASVGRLLEDSYKEATRRDLLAIKNLKKESRFLEVYNAYLSIVDRQQFLETNPDIVGVDGYTANIIFEDVADELVEAKEKAVDALYNSANADIEKYLDTRKKHYARKAYEDLMTLQSLNDNFKDTHKLIEDARDMATLHILVKMENRSFNLLPRGLEFDVIRRGFDNLDNKWVRYYNDEYNRREFDVVSVLELNELDISREYEDTTVKKLKKNIKDGWEYVLDENGNVKKDSLGNDIKVDVFKDIKGKFITIEMRKYAKLNARVIYHNTITQETRYSNDLDVEYVFRDEDYAFKGDERVLNATMRNCLDETPPSFPSDGEILRMASDLLRDKLDNELSRRIYYDRWFK